MGGGFFVHTAPMEAVDYAFQKPSPAGLKAAGIGAAGTYVGPGSAGKHLGAGERDALFANGLDIFLLVEGAAEDALTGASTGSAHGTSAVAAAQALGAPQGVALIAAVDWDVQASQWAKVSAYMVAFGAKVRAAGYRSGIYGGLNCITWAVRDKLASIFFQTYGWSLVNGATRWHPAAQIQQYQNHVTIAGAVVDRCRTMTADFGQWSKKNPVGSTEMILVRNSDDGSIWSSNGPWRWHLTTQTDVNNVATAWGIPLGHYVAATNATIGAYGRDVASIVTGPPGTPGVPVTLDVTLTGTAKPQS